MYRIYEYCSGMVEWRRLEMGWAFERPCHMSSRVNGGGEPALRLRLLLYKGSIRQTVMRELCEPLTEIS